MEKGGLLLVPVFVGSLAAPCRFPCWLFVGSGAGSLSAPCRTPLSGPFVGSLSAPRRLLVGSLSAHFRLSALCRLDVSSFSVCRLFVGSLSARCLFFVGTL